MAEPAPALLAPGTTLVGKYRLDKMLGQGGMGSVWLAENVDIGRTVAIKLLLPALARDAEMMARFRQEARAAAAIGHPSIVDVLDLGKLDDGSAFIVMEHLKGETLGARLSRAGPFPFFVAVWCLREALSAISAAHQKGVIHRDLKPENLFLVLTPVPELKVLDFGISKFRATGGDELSITRTGMTMGTPLYMSPEQARGAKNVGESADLYSLGAIAFQLLVGKPPYEGDSYNELLAKVLTEPPPRLSLARPNLPAPFCAFVDSLLAKDPLARPHSAAEALARLDAVAAELNIPKGRPPALDRDATAFSKGEPLHVPTNATPAARPAVRDSAPYEATATPQARPSPATPATAAEMDRTAPPSRPAPPELDATAPPRSPSPVAAPSQQPPPARPVAAPTPHAQPFVQPAYPQPAYPPTPSVPEKKSLGAAMIILIVFGGFFLFAVLFLIMLAVMADQGMI